MRMGEVAAGSRTAAVPNWEPWLLWTVIAYTVSIAFSREGANRTGSPRRSKAAATFVPLATMFGYTTDLPLESMYRAARAARIYDGPDEVHKESVARRILRGYTPVEVPTEHVPTRTEAARLKFAQYLDTAAANA